MLCRPTAILSLCILVGFAVASVRATDCGDGSDGSVANCCAAQDGICETVCEVGYGVSDDKTECFKCSVKNCVYCDGNPNVCDQVKEPVVQNCSYSSDGGLCIECDSGYNLVEGPKDATHKYWGKQQCLKCKVKNCDQCVKGKMSKCKSCNYGYGPTKGQCKPCLVKNCGSCSNDITSCQWCNDGFGLVTTGKGKSKKTACLPCPKGCFFCDGNNKVCKDDTSGR